ncbi:MAG: Permease of the drug/metabolite transporter (DMT) superfamily, partial [uncultured Lysobacter sp.]
GCTFFCRARPHRHCHGPVADTARTRRARRDLGRVFHVHARGGEGFRLTGAGRNAPGPRRAGAAAVPLARARCVHAAAVAEACADRRDQFGSPVRAVRMGGAARTGRHRRNHERDGRAVHGAGGFHVLPRKDRAAPRACAAGRLRRRGGARQRQDGGVERGRRGRGRLQRRVPVWRRRAPAEAASGGSAAGGRRSSHAWMRGTAGAAVCNRAVASRPGAAAVLGRGDHARRAVHGSRVWAVLPSDPPHRRRPRRYRDLSGAAVCGGLGVDAARRAADAHDGYRRSAHPRQRRADTACAEV